MHSFPIGVMLESFRLSEREALDTAAKLGVQGIQMYATTGAHTPECMDGSARRALREKLKERGLVFSALCGDMGMGFDKPELNPHLIERSKRILDLALELECSVVTTHIGVIPADPSHPRYHILQDACGELSRYADSVEAHFAIETGPETSAVLKEFLDGLGSKGVAVNLDPANLVMVTGDDPVQAVYRLKDYIVHTHAKDGVKLQDRPPEEIYGTGDLDAVIQAAESFREEPLGCGSVPFPSYLQALTDIGYNGFLTIEREVGTDPVADIAAAVKFLRSI